MKKYTELIAQLSLFQDFTEKELLLALDCLQSHVVTYQKKQVIPFLELNTNEFGIVLAGTINLTKNNPDGSRQIILEIETAGLFGESSLFKNNTDEFELEVTSNCLVLYLNKTKIMDSTMTTCKLRQRIIEKLFYALINSNEELYQKVDLATQKSLRARLVCYLNLQAKKYNNSKFKINFSRQELADYLGSDRSSLSRELSKMKHENLLDYEKNSFHLLNANIFSSLLN